MSLRVLLVEDDREMRSTMQSSLAVEGFEVQTATSVSEASALVRNSLPAVVVLDLGLPDGDGLELVQQVRSQHSLPILIARWATRLRSRAHGANRANTGVPGSKKPNRERLGLG